LGGVNNTTNNQCNTFILGSNITAITPSYTYVNNISSQGDVIANGFFVLLQPTPTNFNISSTLTLAHLQTKILTCSAATALTLTLPASSVFASSLSINSSFDFNLINYGSSAGAVTINSGTGVTAPGGPATATGSNVVSIGTSSTFRIRKLTPTTFQTYRIN